MTSSTLDCLQFPQNVKLKKSRMVSERFFRAERNGVGPMSLRRRENPLRRPRSAKNHYNKGKYHLSNDFKLKLMDQIIQKNFLMT